MAPSDSKVPTPGPTVLGVHWTAQFVLLVLASLALTILVVLALYDLLSNR